MRQHTGRDFIFTSVSHRHKWTFMFKNGSKMSWNGKTRQWESAPVLLVALLWVMLSVCSMRDTWQCEQMKTSASCQITCNMWLIIIPFLTLFCWLYLNFVCIGCRKMTHCLTVKGSLWSLCSTVATSVEHMVKCSSVRVAQVVVQYSLSLWLCFGFHQFLMEIPDSLVARCFAMFTS